MAQVARLVDSKMESDDKPFECTASGCGQRFANNDHLESHKQKHQLTLKFGPIKASDSLADQTPTPTRFLRNLEEEGLFQDLENPFDQEFKRAAPNNSEEFKRATATTSEQTTVTTSVINQTPASNGTQSESVIVIEQSNSESSKSAVQAESTSLPTTVLVSTSKVITQAITVPKPSIISAPVSVLVRVPPHMPTVIPAAIANPNLHVPSALPVPGHLTRITHNSMPISIPTPAIVSSPNASHPPTFIGSAKQRLKEQLRQQQNNNATNMNIISQAMTEAVDRVTAEHHNGLPSNHISMHQSTQLQLHEDSKSGIESIDSQWGSDDEDIYPYHRKNDKKRTRRSQEEMDPDERRRKFLERNRAAATRCREKRKIWVQQLEKKADDLSATNSQLQNEISLLKSEVAQLKSLLLAHKDCPVTMAQQKMNVHSQMGAGHVHVTETPNGVALTVSHGETSAEDVATSALTQMAHRATLELEGYGGGGNSGSWGSGD